MRPIPAKLRRELALLPQVCARRGSDCDGRITWEHAIIYAGRQVNEVWAILFLCWYHHLGAGLDKRWNIKTALLRAGPKDKLKYSRIKWPN